MGSNEQLLQEPFSSTSCSCWNCFWILITCLNSLPEILWYEQCSERKINLLSRKKDEILDFPELYPADQVNFFSVLMKQSFSFCGTHKTVQWGLEILLTFLRQTEIGYLALRVCLVSVSSIREVRCSSVSLDSFQWYFTALLLAQFRRWCFNLAMNFFFLLSFASTFVNNISDCMLFVFPELKLCGFRWFSANLAAKDDGIEPILWQAFHLGLMASSVTLAKTSSAFWIAGPLVKVMEHLSARLSASSWQGEMQLALCNNWYIWKTGREEEWKSALN